MLYKAKKKLKEETSKNVAPLDIIPPHSTGGTIDLSIMKPDGKLLKMGTKLGQFNERTYTDSKKISKTDSEKHILLSD